MIVRIALDVTPEMVGSTGVARYSRELRRALEKRTDCQIVPFAVGRRSHPVPAATRVFPIPLRIAHPVWQYAGLPRAEHLLGPVDVVHSLDLVPPPTHHPLVMTVHDIVTAELPQLHTRRSVATQRQQMNALKRAAMILAVSESTAAALRQAGVEPNRIRVTRNGLPTLPEPARTGVRAENYVLMVGNLEPRKGHEILLRAVAGVGAGNLGVVFAGPPVGRDGELKAVAADLGIQDRLEILGSVDEARLAGLYRGARMLCMPSSGEGFGLPMLEAMGAGLPVVASDLPAAREVTAGAALLVPVGDVTSLRDAIERILGDQVLAEHLRASGIRRASAFSWTDTAEKTVEAYRTAARRASET